MCKANSRLLKPGFTPRKGSKTFDVCFLTLKVFFVILEISAFAYAYP
jgi:hypothetical protein